MLFACCKVNNKIIEISILTINTNYKYTQQVFKAMNRIFLGQSLESFLVVRCVTHLYVQNNGQPKNQKYKSAPYEAYGIKNARNDQKNYYGPAHKNLLHIPPVSKL